MRHQARGWIALCGMLGCLTTATPDAKPPTHEVHDDTGAPVAMPDLAERVPGIWISRQELMQLPTRGPAWEALVRDAARPLGMPNLANPDARDNTIILAKAMVAVRTDDATLRDEVIQGLFDAIGTERTGSTLPLGRKLLSYVVAAELVDLPDAEDRRFRAWLEIVQREELEGRTLISTHEKRPNNWGTHAGASRMAVARYLGDRAELARAATVFKGWLGDRAAYSDFEFGDDLSWHHDTASPVGINPAGATKNGHSVDGVLPDDQRRGGPFAWPPPHENYVYEALQGAVAQAVILNRIGVPAWEWSDRALLRAFEWLQAQANFPATGDDTWMLPIVDAAYGTQLWEGTETNPGKAIGWTDWTEDRP